jgi:hypothetical protein
MAPGRRGAALLGAALAVVACTPTGEPTAPVPAPDAPPPATAPAVGLRVGFVLPPAATAGDHQRAQLATDLRFVAGLQDEGISEVRTLEADGPEFVPDLASLLAERGTDLVCVLGPDAQRAVVPLADRYPELRFCAVPAGASDPPDNLTTVELRFEELGHVVGLAAAAVAGEGPVASILGSDRAGVTRLRDGIRAGVDGVPLLENAPVDEEEVTEAVAAAAAAGAEVVIVDLGAGASAAVEQAAAAGLVVVAPAAVLARAEVDEATVLAWRLRWDVAIRPVVASLLDPETEVPASVGFAEAAFVVTSGPALGGPAARAVETAAGELRREVRDPLEPPAAVIGGADAGEEDS